jgi:putative membrane protein
VPCTIFEWRYALAFGGDRANDFLGSQGDIWDAQNDMFMALMGAILAQLFLQKVQNRQLDRLESARQPSPQSSV